MTDLCASATKPKQSFQLEASGDLHYFSNSILAFLLSLKPNVELYNMSFKRKVRAGLEESSLSWLFHPCAGL